MADTISFLTGQRGNKMECLKGIQQQVCVCIRRTASWKPSFFQPPESSTHTHTRVVSMLSSLLHSRSALRGRWWHHYYSSSVISPINREAEMRSSELTPDGWSHPMRIRSSNTHTHIYPKHRQSEASTTLKATGNSPIYDIAHTHWNASNHHGRHLQRLSHAVCNDEKWLYTGSVLRDAPCFHSNVTVYSFHHLT